MSTNGDMPAMPQLHMIDGNWVNDPLPKHAGLTKRELFTKDIYVQFLHGAVLPPGVDVSNLLMQVAERAIESADALLAALDASRPVEPKPKTTGGGGEGL